MIPLTLVNPTKQMGVLTPPLDEKPMRSLTNPNISVETLEQYKDLLTKRLAENLKRIYLENVRSFVNGTDVDVAGLEIEPEERFMRLVESAIDVQEADVVKWRKTIWGAWINGKNTALLDQRLGPIFTKIAVNYQLINRSLLLYSNNLDL